MHICFHEPTHAPTHAHAHMHMHTYMHMHMNIHMHMFAARGEQPLHKDTKSKCFNIKEEWGETLMLLPYMRTGLTDS